MWPTSVPTWKGGNGVTQLCPLGTGDVSPWHLMFVRSEWNVQQEISAATENNLTMSVTIFSTGVRPVQKQKWHFEIQL